VAPVLSLLINRQVTVTVHDLSYLYFPDAYSRAFRLFYNIVIPMVFRWARNILTVSNSEKDALNKVFPEYADKVTAVQNGIFSTSFGNFIEYSVSRLTNSPYALYVGSLSKRKNFDTLIKIAIEITSNSDLDFVFVGAMQSALASSEYSIPEHLRKRIIFTGQVNDKARLVELYRDARVFVFPSLYEASPLPPSEAMACGIPVVTSDIPSLRERCEDAAIFRSPTDVDGIVQAIRELHQKPELHAIYAAKARAQAAKFAWSAAARAVIEKTTA
jgi:glycosyltransferase involved in cell wall biosynthesis